MLTQLSLYSGGKSWESKQIFFLACSSGGVASFVAIEGGEYRRMGFLPF